ncbi:LrgB family protein [Heyndrickxia camelliae]|uniref:LrgB family protein n=1 Tax=Heyndrickxia camelliae TaxID=1707093 RepID=A0A2N3LLM3_9BACI|nr:LrgB family protein [Heyndrickxia camelliae]PKR85506.1 LrgB family protein [Heyndrickxia camelliae]
MMILNEIIICTAFTILGYSLGSMIYNRYKRSWLHPLYTSTIFILIFLFLFHIHAETYQRGSVIFQPFLQLAVVSLAIPLYKQWNFIKQNFRKISIGVVTGTILGIISVILMAKAFHLNHLMTASLIPRSVTLPIALTVSNDLGGTASITVIFVMITGIFSLISGPNLLKKIGINSKAAKGLAMGTSAQMLGASRSMLWGEEEGAMGSAAMTTTAILFPILIPILSTFL